MRLRGEGQGGRKGGQAGDLFVVIHVEPHEFFERDGNTIYCQIPVSMVQAALGCEVEIPTIDEKEKIIIPAGTQTGQTITLSNAGVTNLHGKGRGDMIIGIKVTTPTNLDKRQKELLEEFLQLENEKKESEHEGFFKRLFQRAS